MIITNPLIVRIFINTAHDVGALQNGWAMRIPIYETNWNIAFVQGQALMIALRNILAKDMRIEFASLGDGEFPWQTQALLDAPLGPLPQWGYSETDTRGLWVDYYDGLGGAQGHLFRGIAQSQFDGRRWIWDDVPFPEGITPLPGDLTTATPLQLFQNCLTTFRAYAAISKKLGPRVDGVQQYKLTPVDNMVFVRTSSRRVGYPWRRMSWEAVPWAYAPPFSPCGQVVGVTRGCMLVRVLFHAGGPTRWIHYYGSKPGATVFPYKHSFWGWFTEKDLYNSFNPGELTGNTRRTWATCAEYGNAAGDHLEGPLEGFRGEYLPTYDPTQPTPEDLRPACDNPNTKVGEVEYGGCGVGGPGVAWQHVFGSGALQFAVDSYLIGQEEVAFSVDSLLAEQDSVTFQVDSLLANQHTVQFSVESLLAQRKSRTWAVDSLLKGRASITWSVDSFLGGAAPVMNAPFAYGSVSNTINYRTAPPNGCFLAQQLWIASAGAVVQLVTPTGYTLIKSVSNANGRYYFIVKPVASGDLSTTSVTLTGGSATIDGLSTFVSNPRWTATLDIDFLASVATQNFTVGPTATLAQASELGACFFFNAGPGFVSTGVVANPPWLTSFPANEANLKRFYVLTTTTGGLSATGRSQSASGTNDVRIMTFKA